MSRKRVLSMVLLSGVAALLIALGFAARGTIAYADIATAYAAKQTCSCRHVSGRASESCLDDFPAEARSQFSVVEEGERVRTSALFGLFKAEAVYEDGFGCRILTD